MDDRLMGPFDQRVETALGRDFQRQALRRAQEGMRDRRRIATTRFPAWEEWRARTEAIRAHTVNHLDHYLEQFAAQAEGKGARIFFAATASEATEYVVQLARQKGVKRVVKGKSMVSEEIGLNEALEQDQVETVETDLGEYIIQLAGDRPFHILGPAIHKNREQIRDLFSRVSGQPVGSDARELTRFARTQLRKKFLAADMGITGGNFGVASTGTVVLVTNEGNGRLSSGLPRTHVVIMGMERLVPDWESLDVLLSVLPRSATGQDSTAYVTAITGPKRAEDQDGPEELHIVIVDNGRSRLLGTKYQPVLHCIRCATCLNVCPVYRQIGGHAYGSVYMGPIGAVLTPLIEGLEKWPELPFASSLCGACQEVCPARIPLTDFLADLREDLVQKGARPGSEKLAFQTFGAVMGHPWFYKRALGLVKAVLRFWEKEGRIVKGPGLLEKWSVSRNLPAPPKQSFHDWWEEEGRKASGRNEKG